MATNSDSPSDPSSDSTDYYRHLAAPAPDLNRATFLNHPERGWLPVIAAHSDIETSRVLAVLGRRDEQQAVDEFPLVYTSDYSNTEDLIFTEATLRDIIPENALANQPLEPANIIVKTNDLTTTPTDY
jgi:hypothetical protein